MAVTLFFSQILIYKTQHIRMQTFVYMLTEFSINKTLLRASFFGSKYIKTVPTYNDYVICVLSSVQITAVEVVY